MFQNCSSLISIYCEATSQPEGWDKNWKYHCSADVYWGVSRSEHDAIMNNSVPYTVPQPVISIDSGNVTITCKKAFAHIYYTISDIEPDNTDTLCTEQFTVPASITVKAVAFVGMIICS